MTSPTTGPASTTSHAPCLDPQALAAVDSLELRARMVVDGLMSGMHRSPYFGFSVEFAQHRPYAPGDDLRHLDWKVFARTNKLYLKQYQQETTLDLVLLVDVSGSMSYSSARAQPRPWRKCDHAATLAATLAHLALRQQDRVGLMLFDQQLAATLQPSNNHGQWHALVHALAAALPASPPRPDDPQASAGDLVRLFDQVAAQLARRGLIILISDLFDPPAALERGLARLHHRRHDVIVLQTLDRDELEFPFRAPSEFFGLEGEGRLHMDPAALRKAYLHTLRQHLDQLRAVTRRFGFDHLLLDTHEPLAAPLSHFLARRAGIARAGA